MSVQDKLLQVALLGQRMCTHMAFESLSGCPPKNMRDVPPSSPFSGILTSKNPVVVADLIGDSMSCLGMSHVMSDMKDMCH